ncbi:hypothetical protein F7R21_15750 [Burkholderia latens]|uniref:Uncharacterized protein n=1 Tax=Burkholderia latens TaxID=488446 RepID=A0A6H9SZG0_9BURK|nr:hypothetical protein F7R21_15750 [Burkholderia latens]
MKPRSRIVDRPGRGMRRRGWTSRGGAPAHAEHADAAHKTAPTRRVDAVFFRPTDTAIDT